jgi:hypothetical protein
MQEVHVAHSERPFLIFAMSQPFSDTSPEAAEVQAAIFRKMTGAQRLRIAIEMCETGRKLTLNRLRSQHPDWDDRQLKRELLKYAFHPAPLPADLP